MSVEARILSEISEEHYSSGEDISRKLNISRSAVWKHIVKLRQQGYEIEAAPRHGYRLVRRPDKLLPVEIIPQLKTEKVGGRLVYLEETGSTADEARELIGRGTLEGTVVIAEKQLSGRGRMGRQWLTPPGEAIAISVVLYSGIAPTQAPLLSLSTAVAAARAVSAVTGIEPQLKWPNDIYYGGRKLGGVLVEMSAELDRIKWIIDSIGLNVNNRFSGTPLEGKATSIYEATGARVSRTSLLVALLQELDRVWSQAVSGGGLEPYRVEFERLDMLQGKTVSVKTTDGAISGTAAGINTDGRLLLRGSDDNITELFSGEASIVAQM